jgi:uncharacterized repeat protein (TIGR01451 family)
MGKRTTRGGLAAAVAIAVAIGLPVGAPAGGTEQADLTLINSDSPDPVVTGATLTYTIEVGNKGPAAAPDVAMTDNLPGGATVVSANPSAGTCNPNPHKVVCRLDELAVETTWTIVIAATVTRKQGTMTNAASVQSGLPDPRPGDNSESEKTAIAPPPDPPNCEGVDATLFGTDGDDTLTGTANRDVISALGGNDTIDGLGGDDLICGGSGDDSIRARAGNDLIRAKSGDDVARGGDGSDDVGGGTGRDTLFGGLRPDRLLGGQGRDRCAGGFGADVKIGC